MALWIMDQVARLVSIKLFRYLKPSYSSWLPSALIGKWIRCIAFGGTAENVSVANSLGCRIDTVLYTTPYCLEYINKL